MQIEADDDVNQCDVIKPAMLNKRLLSHCRNSSGASVLSAGSAKASKVSNQRCAKCLCVFFDVKYVVQSFFGEKLDVSLILSSCVKLICFQSECLSKPRVQWRDM